MATTTNYGWTTPDDTALVKDGASAIRTLGSSVDTTTKALNPSTTLGDIEYRSSTANTNTRLGIGTSGQVLAVSGGVPAWTTPAGGGGMTLITTTTYNNTVDSYTYSSLGSYKHLLLVFNNLAFDGTSGADSLKILMNGSTSTVYKNQWVGVQGSSISSNNSLEAEGNLANECLTHKNAISSKKGSAVAWIYNYGTSDPQKFWTAVSRCDAEGGSPNRVFTTSGQFIDTSAITSITVGTISTNLLNTGTMRLYGVS